MKIGIVGGGNISETHARAAATIGGLEIVAFHGENRVRTARLAQQFGGRAYDTFERFVDHRPMDIVAIGSPSGLHAEQGIAAATRGLHVLVEKPIDISVEKADALIEAAERHGVKLGVFFQDRLRPAVLEMKHRIDAGDLGRPVLISGRVRWYRPPAYYSESRWRGTWKYDGGGALMNQAIHTVDLMLWLFGPVARVSGVTATRLHAIEVEDTAVAAFEFANGAAGSIEAATSVFPGYPRRLEVTGSAGTMVLEADRLVAVDLRDGAQQRPEERPQTAPVESASSPVVSDASAHQRVIEDFMHAIRTNGTPACDGREGRRSVELVRAIYESARARQPVALVAGRLGETFSERIR